MPGYKRKYTYANTSSYRRHMKSRKPYRKPVKRKISAFAKRVKAVVLKTCELKRAPISVAKVEVYHNAFAGQTYKINGSGNMPLGGGLQQSNRIGDQINTMGWKIRLLFGQKADRPNVNWRFIVFQIPKGNAVAYNDVFKNVTGNVMLDETNTDTTKVLFSRTFRPNQAGLMNAGQDEYTFIKKYWIPHKKLYKFGPGENVQDHNQMDVYVAIMAFDAFGAAITDNIGYMQMFFELHYKDP